MCRGRSRRGECRRPAGPLLPDWPTIAERLQRDASMRRRQIQQHGTLPMLTNLHSDIAWRPRTAPEGPGRGLILAPCLFGQQRAHGGPELTVPGRQLVEVNGPATS